MYYIRAMNPPRLRCAVISYSYKADTELHHRLPQDSELQHAWLVHIGLSVTDKRKCIYVCE